MAVASRRDVLAAGATALAASLFGTPQALALGINRDVVDSIGRRFVLPRPPERIIVNSTNGLSALAALRLPPIAMRLDPRAVRASAPYLFPNTPGVASSPSVLNADWSVNPELVSQIRPDLILTWNSADTVTLSSIAPVYVMRNVATLSDSYIEFRNLADALGVPERAEIAIHRFERRLEAYERLSPRTRTLLLSWMGGRNFFIVVGPGGQLHEMLSRVTPYASGIPASRFGWVNTGPEAMSLYDADLIALSRWGLPDHDTALRSLKAHPLTARISAVRAGRVISFNGYEGIHWDHLLPMARLLDTVMPALYPETFPAPLTEAQIAAVLDG
jgi:ABC-type Fe3+-hydroxamate transport system substrate-binding protein